MLKKIGYRIRKIRETKDLTQENMGEELGINGTSYSKIERGEVNISIIHLIKIAEILKVSVIDFLDEKTAVNIREKQNPYGFATKEELQKVTETLLLLMKEVREVKDALAVRSKNTAKSKK